MLTEQQKIIALDGKEESIQELGVNQNILRFMCYQKEFTFNHGLKAKREAQNRKAKSLKEIVRRNKVKRLVDNFIKKLRMNSTRRQPHPDLEDNKQDTSEDQSLIKKCKFILTNFGDQEGVVFNNYFLVLWNIINVVLTCLMVFIFSVMMAFEETQNYPIFFKFQIVSCVVYVLDVLLNFVLQRYENGKKLTKLCEIYEHYIAHEFLIDLVSILLFPASVAIPNSSVNIVICLIYVVKTVNCLRKFEKFEYLLITSNEKEQYYGLFKVFVTNFVIGHFLSIFLNLMSNLNSEINWHTKLNITNSPWFTKYIWGYYWGTNIMLTVGFGDISAANETEAIFLVFIETFSCITLAYNISYVGALIGTIRENQESKKRKLKIFHRMCKENEVCNQVESKISNFIEESYQIKETFEHDARDEVIEFLPRHLQSEYRKEANKILFDGLGFLNNLSKKSLLTLAEEVNRRICHPEEVIVKKGNITDFCIIQKGCVAFTCRNRSDLDNKVIELLAVEGESKPKILSLDFIKNKPTSYNIKSVNYSIIYYLSREDFMRSLSSSEMDYQLFCLLKDKDEYLLNQNNLYPCSNCKNQYHNNLDCSRLHYIPIKQIVISRYLNKTNKKVQSRQSFKRVKAKIQKFHSLIKKIEQDQQRYIEDNFDPEHYRQIQELVRFYRKVPIAVTDTTDENFFAPVQARKATKRRSHIYTQMPPKSVLDEKAINKIEELLEKKQNSFWEFQTDLAQDYNYYFQEGNPENLSKKRLKRGAKWNFIEKSSQRHPRN